MLRLPFGRRGDLRIDLGSHACKYLIERADGSRALGAFPTPPGAVRGTYTNLEIDYAALASACREALSGERDRFRLRLLCGDQFMKMLYLRLPRDAAPAADLDYTRFRARRALDPAIAADAEIDLAVIEPAADSALDRDATHLSLLCAKRSLLRGLRDAFHGGRFELGETVSTSAALCAIPAMRGEREFALVNLGHEVTTVNLVAEGVLLYQRVIETAGRHLAEAVAAAEGADPAEARRRVETGTALPAPDGPLAQAVLDFPRTRLMFAPLFDELSVTFKFYRESLRRPSPPLVYLAGGMARMAGIAGFFAGVLRLPVAPLELAAAGLAFAPDRAALAEGLLRAAAPAAGSEATADA